MRLIDADELMEHVWRDKLGSRELIAQMIATAPTIKEIPTEIPINIFERILELAESEQEPKTGHWEWVTEDKYRCSNCNSETRVDECMNEPMYEFCPFCRAIMKSEVSE